MLRAAFDAVTAVGLKICNLDCIVFAQRPKLLPHKQMIRENLAEILNVETERIGLQAKTGENVGPVGREEAIEAQCVVLLEPIGEK
jgi:2-C-methyl-D-erythritol 2,4-cyclodiphosphate synthase